MNKAEFVDSIANACDMTKADAARAVDDFGRLVPLEFLQGLGVIAVDPGISAARGLIDLGVTRSPLY